MEAQRGEVVEGKGGEEESQPLWMEGFYEKRKKSVMVSCEFLICIKYFNCPFFFLT